MNQYNFFHGFCLSFFSKPFYHDVGRRWRFGAWGVLFVTLLICWGVLGVKMQLGLMTFMDETDLGIMEQVPELEIKNGIVSSDVEQPYEISFEENGKNVLLAVLDTTGEINSLDDTEAMMLLTRDKLYYRNDRQTRIQNLTGINFHLTQAKLKGWVATFRWLAIPLIVIFGFIFALIKRIFLGFVYSLVAMLVAHTSDIQLPYVGCLQIAVIAMVPVIVVDTLHSLLGSPLPAMLWWLVCVGGAVALIIRGVLACREEAPPPEPMPPPEEQFIA